MLLRLPFLDALLYERRPLLDFKVGLKYSQAMFLTHLPDLWLTDQSAVAKKPHG